MQGPDARIPFLIDALCIDQDNGSEKSHQVHLMKKIYSQAYKVLVWLGPPSEDSELALAKMRAIEAWSYINTHANEPVVEGHDENEKNPKESKNGSAVRKHSNGYEPIMFLYEEHDKEFSRSLEAITNFLRIHGGVGLGSRRRCQVPRHTIHLSEMLKSSWEDSCKLSPFEVL
jgi:hypothetical protein